MISNAGYVHDEAYNSGRLRVSELHSVQYSQYGRPDGKPVMFLHGGPGGLGCTKLNTSFFDPKVYRVVLMDQRGAGQSEPNSEIQENSTDLLIQDIETLRKHVGVTKWHMVFGGSWGSTLSLAYAQAHPEVCGSLVLRGVFLGSFKELQTFMSIASLMYPEDYDRFLTHLPESKRDNPLESYYEIVMGNDQDAALAAAKEWAHLEMACSFLQQDHDMLQSVGEQTWVMSHAKIELHYFKHDSFFRPGQLLEDCMKIQHIPVSIVQGRYDLCCPPRRAWDLHNALPQSELHWSPMAGHSAMEPGTLGLLTRVCDRYAENDFHL